MIGSGIRHDLALCSPPYIEELVCHHVSGYLKVAPEHSQDVTLRAMNKPKIRSFERFMKMFEDLSRKADKRQYLVPYFIAAHPACGDHDMLQAALWLKRHNFKLDQVQTFLPTPMTVSSAMYHSGLSLGAHDNEKAQPLAVARGLKQRRLQKAFLRYHDPANWPDLRKALIEMGRADLIGPGPACLVPSAGPGKARAK